jgi:hypothetical protein
MPSKHSKAISAKIKKIMDEGVKGKKVPQKQAVAIAINMVGKGKKHGGKKK